MVDPTSKLYCPKRKELSLLVLVAVITYCNGVCFGFFVVYDTLLSRLHSRWLRTWRTSGSADGTGSQGPMVVGQMVDRIWKFHASSSNWKAAEAAVEDDNDEGLRFEDDAIDVETSNSILGHKVSGDDATRHGLSTVGTTTIAIGGGITSKGLTDVNGENMAAKFQLFNTLMPSFCSTASPNFTYGFYLAYDFSDVVLSDRQLLGAFQRTFDVETGRLCAPRHINVSLHLVRCSHTGKPTWAQNDAMLEAYLDHVDYYYRINDDTEMLTDGWTEAFVDVLDHRNPPRVGVVGPNHSGGNTAILTYDFVHRTHVDVFGFYYPRVFTDWWADNWVTEVYKPGRSTKLYRIKLAHTLALGQRYETNWKVRGTLAGQLAHDIATLNRYIAAVKADSSTSKKDGRKVIAMSLFGKDPRYCWGAIRNAQLIHIYLPGWTLRVYIADDPSPPELTVPARIVNKLRLLGAEIARVPNTADGLSPRNWRLLVANDRRLSFFLVRDADYRLSDREAAAIREWVASAEAGGADSAVVHCIRDHPRHVVRPLTDGLWGGRPAALRRAVWRSLSSSASEIRSSSDLLNLVVWPAIGDQSLCHDSISPCDRWPAGRHPFPDGPRTGGQFVGQKFDEHQELIGGDTLIAKDVHCDLTVTTRAAHAVSLDIGSPTTPIFVAPNGTVSKESKDFWSWIRAGDKQMAKEIASWNVGLRIAFYSAECAPVMPFCQILLLLAPVWFLVSRHDDRTTKTE